MTISATTHSWPGGLLTRIWDLPLRQAQTGLRKIQQLSSVERVMMFDVETGQRSAVETGQKSAVETRQHGN